MASAGRRQPTILVIGTGDTKADELEFLKGEIAAAGAVARLMDVSVLGDPPYAAEHSKHDVAAAAGATIAEIIALGDENSAMAKMADGAARLGASLQSGGEIDAMLALGGTMGTDLALDVAAALPLGVPKFVVSTVAFSPLLPPERIAADVMMILWAGGLYGLNSICKATLSQAAGAVVGAARAGRMPQREQPVIAMSSLGSSSLKYMLALKPALEQRGFEVAVFHTTGMGGRAMEALAAKGSFAAVLDFSLVEVSNHCHGSVVSAGADRLQAAGRAGIPQIVAPGGVSLVDLQAWADVPANLAGREIYAHNRLISCALMTAEEKRAAARVITAKLAAATGPTTFIMPLRGIDEWDRPGGPFHAPDGLAAFADELSTSMPDTVDLIELDGHINDPIFAETALAVLDRWIDQGRIAR